VENSDFPLCYLGVGSNLGDRLENIKASRRYLEESQGIRFRRNSSLYKTAPVGIDGAPDFYNCVFEIETSLTPFKLLALCKEVERRMGRDTGLYMRSRKLDLDILIYGDLTLKTQELIIPHSRMHERLFVIAPLNDLTPDLVHPTINKRVSDLLLELEGKERVECIGSLFG